MAVDKTPRERLEDQVASLKSQRDPFEADWEEIGRLCSPARVDIGGKFGSKAKRRANTKSQDLSLIHI